MSMRFKLIFLFLLAAVFIFVLSLVFYQKHGLQPYLNTGDAGEYETVAINIISHATFSLSDHAPYEPSNWRTPIYPLWLALIHLLSGSFIPAIFLGILVFALSAPLIYLIGKEVFNERIGRLAAILFIFEPWSAAWAGFLMAEQIFVPLFLLASYLFVRYLKYGFNKSLYFSAALWGIASLTKPIAFYLFPLLLILTAIFLRRSKHITSATLITAVLIFIIVMAPWLIRNKLTLNTWQVSSSQGTNLYIYKFSALQYYLGESKYIALPYQEISKTIGGLDITTQTASDILSRRAMDGIRAHPFVFAEISLFSLPDFFIRNSYGSIANYFGSGDFKIQNQISNSVKTGDWRGILKTLRGATLGGWLLLFLGLIWPAVAVFGCIGFFAALRKFPASKIAILSFAVMILYIAIVTTLVPDWSRYRLPVEPFLFMFAIIGFIHCFNLKNA